MSQIRAGIFRLIDRRHLMSHSYLLSRKSKTGNGAHFRYATRSLVVNFNFLGMSWPSKVCDGFSTFAEKS